MDGPDVCGGSSASVRNLGRSPSDGRSRCLWRFVCVSEEPRPFLRLMDGPDVCGGSSASVRNLGRSPSDGRFQMFVRFVCVSEEPRPFSV